MSTWGHLSALMAPVATLAGALLGAWWQGRKDDQRWGREVAREEKRWNREDGQRWLDEQYRIYTGLIAAAWLALRTTRTAFDRSPAFAGLLATEEVEEQARREADAARIALFDATESAMLVGHADINVAANDFVSAVLAVHAFSDTANGPALEERINEMLDCWHTLRLLAREALGIEAAEGP